jgi:hypothetical protein
VTYDAAPCSARKLSFDAAVLASVSADTHTMNDEHDDDMSAEVHEGAQGEADQYAVLDDDVDQRAADLQAERLRQMERNLEKAEGDELAEE